MAQIAPYIFPQFFDDNGDPLNGGLIYAYAAGTTTPQNTYSNAAGTSANTNPIVLSSSGRTKVFLQNLAYDFVIKNSAGETIDSISGVGSAAISGGASFIDTISELRALASGAFNYVEVGGYAAKGDGGGGLFYWDATETAADLGINVQPNSLPAAGRWVRLYSGDVNVKWFGAKGNTTTDDLPAIAAANTYVASLTNGGTLYFPESSGGYLYTSNPSFNAKTFVRMEAGAYFTSAGVAITFGGGFDAALKTAFSATVGAVSFAPGREVPLEWFGTMARAAVNLASASVTLVIGSSASVPATLDFAAAAPNVMIRTPQGGSFNVASGQILTIPVPETGAYRIFYGDGVVRFASGTGRDLYVQNWGAKADDVNGGQTDNAVPFQAALEATTNGIRLLVPDGEYGFRGGFDFTQRNHLVGTRKTRFWPYGSTSGSPQTFITLDGTASDFNGGIENIEIIQAGEVLTGTCFYLVGAPGVQNVQRIIFRDVTIRRFEKGLHIESVSYINAFYNIRMTNVVNGIYAVDAVNAVNFYGCYIDCRHPTTGLPIPNSYGIRWNGANNPTYYTICNNFFGGAIENCEHALYTSQAVPFTAQFYGVYFESGDIDIQQGQVTMSGCSTQHSGAYHIQIAGGTILNIQNHRFGGSLSGVDPASSIVRCLGSSVYIEEGRIQHQSMTGLTGRTDPKMYRDTATSYVRYWGINASTGGEDGYVTEFGTSRRFREAATDDAFYAFNKTTTSTVAITSERVKAINALAATIGLQVSNLADVQKVEVKSTGIDLTNSTGTYPVAIGTSGSSIHLALTRLVLTGLLRLANYATGSRPTTDLITYAQINDTDLGQQLVYSGSGTIWRTQSRRWRILKTGVNLNNAAADVASIIGLPAKYRIIKIMAFDASINLSGSAATYDLRTASGGGGSAIVSAMGVTALSAATKFADGTIAAAYTGDYATATTLWIRNVTAHGSAATASFMLEIEQLD